MTLAPGLEYRVRPDLSGVEYAVGGEWRTVLKDPASSRYWTLSTEEAFLLSQFDGRSSFAQIIRRFAESFPPQRITPEQLKEFADSSFRDGLLLAERDGGGAVLLARAKERRSAEAKAAWINPLYIRLASFSPQPWLDRLVRWTAPCFSSSAAAVAWSVVAAAVAVAILAAPEMLADAKRLARDAGLIDAAAIVVAYALVKSLHEIAHAVVCRRVGAECREIGLVLLCFSPCVYCDVSDAWMTPGRRRRIAVAAAGVVTECIVAAVCLLLWRFTLPGAVHDLALAVAGVASINTLLLNGNPLMRFDGYYVFSDLVGAPNLSFEAGRLWRGWFMKTAFGVDLFAGYAPPLGRPALLALYGAAAVAYRILVLATLAWIGLQWSRGTPWESLMRWALALVVVLLAVSALKREVAYFMNPAFRRRLNPVRTAAAVLVLAAVCTAASIPVPRRVEGLARLAPRGERVVVAATDGRVESLVEVGTEVQVGDLVARLASPELEQTLRRAEGDVEEQAAAVRRLEVERFTSDEASAELAIARESLAAAQDRLTRKKVEAERLTARAPIAGVVLPAWRRDDAGRNDLPRWSGSLHDAVNGEALIAAGDPICRVGDPAGVEVEVLVSEEDREYLVAGQKAWATFRSAPGRVLAASVAAVSRSAVETGAEDATQDRPAEFPVRLTLSDELPSAAAWGDVGRARIAVAPESTWRRFVRFARRTLKL